MKQKDILWIVIPTFVLVMAWIGFSIYHNIVDSTITEAVSQQIKPISGQFDQQTINEVRQRERVTPLYQGQFIPSETTPSAQPEPTPSASPAAEQTEEVSTTEAQITP